MKKLAILLLLNACAGTPPTGSVINNSYEYFIETADSGTTEEKLDSGADMGFQREQQLRGGWAQSGNILTQTPNSQVRMQAIFPDIQNYTIQFGVNAPPSAVAFQTQAEIIWKVAGNQTRRLISVASGTSITAPAEAVDVIVTDVATSGGGAGTAYGVTMTIAKGTRFGGPCILQGLFKTTLVAGGSTTVAVPQNAGVVGVWVGGASTPAGVFPDLDVQQLSTFGNAFGYTFANGAMQEAFVPLVPGASSVQITNKDAANSVVVTLTWEIDG